MKPLLMTLQLLLIGSLAFADDIAASPANPPQMLYQVFEVTASETGYHDADLWLSPAILPDGNFTSYKVAVEYGNEVSIYPAKSSWHTHTLSENNALFLKQGTNRIFIGAPGPEVPMVESIRVYRDGKPDLTADAQYAHYLDNPVTVSVIEEYSSTEGYNPGEGMQVYSPNETIKKTYIVPLLYSYWSKYYFIEGEWIDIETESDVAHCVDLMFYGHPMYTGVQSEMSGPKCADAATSDLNDLIPINPPGPTKPAEFLVPADDREMQFLNWTGISEKGSDGRQHILKPVRIPYTGYYLVKLRGAENGSSGKAGIKVGNGSRTMQPFSYQAAPVSIPADTGDWAVYTSCSQNTSTSRNVPDPMLFIEGNEASRIVAYGDDKPFSSARYKMTDQDVMIKKTYDVRTTGVHVSNYSSATPTSSCRIVVSQLTYSSIYDRPVNAAAVSEVSEMPDRNLEKVIVREGILELRGFTRIDHVIVHTADGKKLFDSGEVGGHESIDLFMNERLSGICVITVEDNGRTKNFKVIL